MRYLTAIIFFLILISCSDSINSEKQKILDELSIGLLEAWSETLSANYIPQFDLTEGDSFTIESEILIIRHLPDSLIKLDCDECYIPLPENTNLKISAVLDYVVNLETKDVYGNKIKGYLFKDDLLKLLHPSIDYDKKRLLKYFDHKREILKSRLMDKYGLTEDEFYQTVGKEYSKRTGINGFSF